MTMLEKIARAMEEAALNHGIVTLKGDAHNLTTAMAIAAVKAMREPTDEMLSARQVQFAEQSVRQNWRAMIDSILATQPQEQDR